MLSAAPVLEVISTPDVKSFNSNPDEKRRAIIYIDSW